METADAMLALLRRFAQETGHLELADAPLLFWGHSAMGNWGPDFAALHSERTIACVLYHSAGGGIAADRTALTQIPTLIFSGGKDDTGKGVVDPIAFFERGRAANGPWTYALEPNASHGDSRDLVKANDLLIPWTAAVMHQRVSPDRKSLRPVTDSSAFLGSNETGEFASYSRFTGPKAKASWLPDGASLQGWRAVIGVEK